MFTKYLARFLLLVILASIFSCTATYRFKYSTYISEPETEEQLIYEDSLFIMEFLPVPNGIMFNITNKTNEMAYLQWNQSYIVYPNGNSFKALNEDMLNLDERLREKETNESLIPPGASLKRFTTNAQNIDVFKEIYTSTYVNTSLNKVFIDQQYNEFYTHKPYWPIQRKMRYDYENELDYLEELMLKEYREELFSINNIGLGFRIKIDDKNLSYDFRFKIDEVEVYRKISGDYDFKLNNVLDRHNDYKPEDADPNDQ